jgi:probable phosphoglycerate mutase
VTTVYVVRHGRTTLNAQGRYRGLEDPRLDAEGRAQALAAASALAGRPIAAVEHSPLARARETAVPIAREARVEPAVLELLLDLDHGAWTALTPEEAEALAPEAFRLFRDDPRTCTPPGGEPMVDVERRILAAIDSLDERHPGAEVVAVSHEIPIRLLISHLRHIDGPDVWDLPLATGSITTVRGTQGSWRLE